MSLYDDYSLEQLLKRTEEQNVIDDYGVHGISVEMKIGSVEVEMNRQRARPYVLGLIQGCRRANREDAETPLPELENAALY